VAAFQDTGAAPANYPRSWAAACGHPLLRPWVLFVRYWPQLAACYLLGYLGRQGAIELAAWAGHDNGWWASLIMPLAGIARLGSYIAMFLVLRSAIPVLAQLAHRPTRQIDTFTKVVVPFFAIYLAWQMFREDWLAFKGRTLDYTIGEAMTSPGQADLDAGSIPVGVWTWVLVVAALVARWALNRLKDNMPPWTVAVRLYVDALWVFLVLSFSVNQGLTVLINPASWIQERRIVVWFNTTRAELFSHFQPLETAWDSAMWALRTAFGGAAVPLLWLAIAGIVYGVTLTTDWRQVARRVAGDRATVVFDRSEPAQKRIQGRWSRAPKAVRDKTREHAVSRLGKFKPIVDSARIILHAGVFALSLYVLGYLGLAWLDMAGSFYSSAVSDGYLFRAMAWVVGPHSELYAIAEVPTLSLISHLLVEPLRICLIASTFAYCLEHAARQAEPAPQGHATAPTAP
jgi:hypothetical protein